MMNRTGFNQLLKGGRKMYGKKKPMGMKKKPMGVKKKPMGAKKPIKKKGY
jgi:hypothetical protein